VHALLLTLAVWGANPAGVRVTGSRLPDCVSVTRIEDALEPVTGNREGTLTLEGLTGGRLAVKLVAGGATSERTLSVGSDECAEAERTIVLLVTAWLSPRTGLKVAPAASPPDAGAVAVVPPPADAGTAASSTSASVASSTAASSTASPSTASPSTASPSTPPIVVTTPPPSVTAENAAAPDAGTPPLVAAVVTPPPPEAQADTTPAEPQQPSRFQLGASLRGHVLFDGKLMGAGSAVIDAGLRSGFGALIDGGFEGTRQGSIMTIGFSYWLAFTSVLVRYAFPLGDWTLTPALGFRLFIFTPRAGGPFQPAEPTVFAPAGALAVELRRQVFRGLFFSVSLTGYVRQQYDLVIHGIDLLLDSVLPFGGSLALGAGWDFF